ncbi:MAG: UDP-N-acetylmuramate--L-alanine ligase [Bacillota bacterium]|nr:UDP-N-acetylmuramate--L-alanine ligase [Bacillota bacterium]
MEKHLHFIGIGGIGMSAIAKIMLGMGFKISGSDLKEAPLTIDLAADGAHIYYSHAAANIGDDVEAVVYSSAVKESNPEMREARRRGLKVYKRAEMLSYLMSTRVSIGVAGAHGKTTTSGMIATMLEYADQQPTIIIGGMLPAIGGGNAKAGLGRHLVAEADESDGTFLLLRPAIAVVTNIEADHLDYYHNFDNIVSAFAQYLRQVPEQGFAVVCADCEIAAQLARQECAHYISYALHHEADYTAADIVHGTNGVSADVYAHQQRLGRLQLAVPGAHNVANALAAIAVGCELGLSFEQCAAALAHFTGTGRRFEYLGHAGSTPVIDDYAHHPTEISATIQAARDMGAGKLLAVFQPHRYSRTQSMFAEFAQALYNADTVILNEIYPAFEQPIEGVSAQLIVDHLRKLGHTSVLYAADIEQAKQLVAQNIEDKDMLLIMGAGNIRALGEQYLDDMRRSKGE